MHYLTDTSHPETRVMGGPSRVQVAEVVAVNTDDGTIDASLLNGRATKVHVAYPTWWVPQVGERCLLADRDGDARQPVCLGFLSPADGSNAGPQLQGTVSLAKASDTALGITKLSTAPAVAANPIAVGDNDPRNTDARTPTGAAGGDLSGTYPNPSVVKATDAVYGKARLSVAAASAADPIAVGDNDTRVPTAAEAAALLGTSGAPSSGNKYVTDADARNTNSRAPTGAAGGDLSGTYPNPTVAKLSAQHTRFGLGGDIASIAVDNAGFYSNYDSATNRLIDTSKSSWAFLAGAGGDVFNIYRAPATAGVPAYAQFLSITSAGSLQLDLASNGQKILFGSAADVNLFRAAADTLKTDDTFVALDLFARGSTASQVLVGDMAGKAAIQFGSAVDVNLYRAAAGCLKTDSMLSVAGSSPPAAGQSLEAGCQTGVAFFQAFDRTAGSAIKLHLQGSEVSFYDAAAHCRLMIDANGVGFFAVTPVARAAAYTQTYATASRTHSNPTATAVATTAATSTTPFGYTTAAQANAIVTAVNALITDVANVKQVLNSVVDDHQAYGLLQ